MKHYRAIVVMGGLVCTMMLSTGCLPPPPPPPPSGDFSAKELTWEPYQPEVNGTVSIHFEVANVGNTDTKGKVSFSVVGPGIAFYNREYPITMTKGEVRTEIDTGWHPVNAGGFVITCKASADNDTNPSNDYIRKNGYVELSGPIPFLPPPRH